MQVATVRVFSKDALNQIVQSHKQAPFALSKAINVSLFDTQLWTKVQMGKVFDRPVQFTINSLYVKRTTKQDLNGWIGFREWASKGTPAVKYLQAEVYGGERRPKRYEAALRRKNIIGPNQYTIPSKRFQDAHGNVQRAMVIKMLSGLGAFSEAGYRANWSGLRDRTNVSPFFVGKRGQDDRNVIWYAPQGAGGGNGGGSAPIPFMFIIDSPRYKARFHFEDLATAMFGRQFPKRFQEAWAYALATART